MLIRRNDVRIFDFDKRAVAYWMEVDGRTPVQPVRVLVTSEALSSIDPSQPHDFDGALDTFDKNRDRIDEAASAKFGRGELSADLHEGQPAIVLIDMDL